MFRSTAVITPLPDAPPPTEAAGIPPPPPPPPFEPPRKSGLSRGARTAIAVLVIAAIVMIGIIGYAVAGFAYASSRSGSAQKSLTTVISHQSSLNTTFQDINAKFTSLNSSSFDPVQAKTLMSEFVASAQAAGATIDKDDASLVAARSSLDQQQWLTALSRGRLEQEKNRIDHARAALAAGKSISTDYVQDGLFLQSFIDAASDLDTLGAQTSTSDLSGAKSTLATMKTHVDKALQLSTAPGLPTELHSLMVDFESLVTDFGKLLDAAAAGDLTTLTSSEKAAEADANKMSSYNFDSIGAQIDAFYKPLLDSFNSEMAKATA